MNENKKVPNHNTKKDKITTIIIVALIIFSGIYLFWDNFMGAQLNNPGGFEPSVRGK